MQGKTIATLLAVLGLLAVLFNHQVAPAKSEFEQWKSKFGVSFESMFEEAYRERLFFENLAEIKLHNSNGLKTYTQGVNQFTAMTQEEFKQTYLGLVVPPTEILTASTLEVTMGDIDWVSAGAVTPVKNQGNCGSCWAFSATGGLEGLSKIAYGSLQSFSEQQLVDCSGSYGNQACNGGLMVNAFSFIRDNGIVLESQYPYVGVQRACSKKTGPFKVSGYTEIRDCPTLADAVQKWPVSVAVDASNWSRYASGVFTNCGTGLNHGVTLVGISSGNWWVKNSWATSWGEKGFIRLAAGNTDNILNTCGICNMASYPNK